MFELLNVNIYIQACLRMPVYGVYNGGLPEGAYTNNILEVP